MKHTKKYMRDYCKKNAKRLRALKHAYYLAHRSEWSTKGKNWRKDNPQRYWTYNSWKNMIRRCTDPSAISYSRYGGRGVTVSKRWLAFKNFLEDMGYRPSKEWTLERKKSDRGYTKSNCRWATWEDQGRNRPTNIVLCLDGESHHMAEWARILGVKEGVIQRRRKSGWTVREILTTPVKVYRRQKR